MNRTKEGKKIVRKIIKINGTALEFIKISGSLDYPFEERSCGSLPFFVTAVHWTLLFLFLDRKRLCYSFAPECSVNQERKRRKASRAKDEWAPIKKFIIEFGSCLFFLSFHSFHSMCAIFKWRWNGNAWHVSNQRDIAHVASVDRHKIFSN